MNDAQQRLLWLLVQEFVANADFDAAEAQLALVQEGWGDTHFAWQGPPPDPAARFYFRVHGPRILIEYDVQEPLTSQGGHVHAITRDPTNDYGMDWLGLHYSGVIPATGWPGRSRWCSARRWHADPVTPVCARMIWTTHRWSGSSSGGASGCCWLAAAARTSCTAAGPCCRPEPRPSPHSRPLSFSIPRM